MMPFMRTTLTLQDDLARKLREKAHREGVSFKEVANNAIREGLSRMDRPKKNKKPYKCKSYSLGYPPRADLDHALELADGLESEEIARKLLH